MSFEIASPNRIIFGPGRIREVVGETKTLGKKLLLVCGRSRDRCGWLRTAMEEAGCQVTLFHADPEPSVELVLQGVKQARESQSEFIVGMGGGSAIDTGKAISALLTNPGDPFEYLEVIGRGHPLLYPAAPYVAIPTTAGTGAEVTRNAVLSSPFHGVKVSLRSPKMLPFLALVDPELTYSLPASVTASTGMDALTQVIEAFVSCKANPFTDSLCREGIRRAARSLRKAFRSGNDPAARADMALTSLFSGLSLANAGLGAVHGLAGPLGGVTGAPHGAICAAILPHVMRTNIRALQCVDNSCRFLGRYDFPILEEFDLGSRISVIGVCHGHRDFDGL
ncbi:MAG: iron-containing alcohol dehydrogenase, partial [bacterium]